MNINLNIDFSILFVIKLYCMRKMRVLTIFLTLFMFFSVGYSGDNGSVSTVFFDIIDFYNNGNKEIFNYVDANNTELLKKIKGNMGNGVIKYSQQVNYKSLGNDEYLVGVQMSGSGKVYNSSWAFADMFVTFKFRYDENKTSYVLTETDLFDKSGIDLLRKSYSELFINVLVISFFIFTIMMIVSYRIYRRALEDEVDVNKM